MALWIFAYGSLLWRPGFSFEERRAAIVRGFERRIEQGSPDHRGTPERLGRVATLVEAPQASVDGVVFALPPAQAPEILAMLDEREQGGYDRVRVAATLRDGGETIEAITWIARP